MASSRVRPACSAELGYAASGATRRARTPPFSRVEIVFARAAFPSAERHRDRAARLRRAGRRERADVGLWGTLRDRQRRAIAGEERLSPAHLRRAGEELR